MRTEVSGVRFADIYASLLAWLLLAGFIVLPATMASFRHSRILGNIDRTGEEVLDRIYSIPLLVIAGTSCACGSLGLLWLCWKNKTNHIWLEERVFLPTLLNAVVSLISALINVYTTDNGYWSVTAIITVIVVILTILVTMTLYAVNRKPINIAWGEHERLNQLHHGR
ncbi:hypothetical protein B0O99DRAFT_503568 [Bisporella sp. PMI_857]|nr:hypothetical protein B0O99DRAFT_503568 [Bisporella sp. PMI_857]